MSSKWLNTFCFAAILALSTCKGAINPAYANDAFNEYTQVRAGQAICGFDYNGDILDTAYNNALTQGTKEEIETYVQEQIVVLVLSLPMMGVSKEEFCKILYTDHKRQYN